MEDNHITNGIAVIGLSGKFPESPSIEEFWENLCNGNEGISFFTNEELRSSNEPDSLINNPAYVPARGIIEHEDMFDASFFGYLPREAEIMDPQQRLFLEVCWHAMEDAGYNPYTCNRNTGVFGASSISSYLIFNILSNKKEYGAFGNQIIIQNDKDFLATRVSYKFNLTGPSLTIQSACSSALVAVHLACQSLLTLECDMALAGGVSISIPQKQGYLHTRGGIESGDGHCRPFDSKANGTVFSNGLGVVVLKRLSDAMEDRDYIYAVIRSTAINNDGATKVGFTAPSSHKQTDVITEALALANIHPETIGYIECHGTGTELGDPIEITALHNAFRKKTTKKGFCAIGSVKSNIGHIDVAAGIAGLIKTILILKHKKIPPTINFSEPNPKIDFKNTSFYINSQLSDWPRKAFPRRTGVSSFGIGGTNAHVVLEEAPVVVSSEPVSASQLLVFSARTETALIQSLHNLKKYLQKNRGINPGDIAYTLAAGREHFAHRMTFMCKEISEFVLSPELEQVIEHKKALQLYKCDRRNIYFIFPAEIKKEIIPILNNLYEMIPHFRHTIDTLMETAASLSKPEIVNLLKIDSGGIIERNSGGIIDMNINSLPEPERILQHNITLFFLEYALAHLWMYWGIKPKSLLAGGIGELAAACIARSLTLKDALTIICMSGKNECEQTELSLSLHPLLSPSIPFYSCSLAMWFDAEKTDTLEFIKSVLSNQGDSISDTVLKEQPKPFFLSIGSDLSRKWIIQENIPVLTSLKPAGSDNEDYTYLVSQLGELWKYGFMPDWEHFFAGQMRRRIPLPGYPFERQRYWIENRPQNTIEEDRNPVKQTKIQNWLYTSTWKQKDLSITHSIAAFRVEEEESSILLFSDNGISGAHLADKLSANGFRVFTVKRGLDFLEADNETFIINPEKEDDYKNLFSALTGMGVKSLKIFYLFSLDYLSNDRIIECMDDRDIHFYSLLYLARALSISAVRKSTELVVVSRGLYDITGYETLQPLANVILGPLKVIPQDVPGVKCFHFDLDPAKQNDEDKRVLVSDIVKEFLAGFPKPVVAIRGTHRWVQDFIRIESFDDASSPPLRGKKGGVYLITGGLGGIGMVLADYLASQFKATLILTGRSEVPSRDEWEKIVQQKQYTKLISIIQNVRKLERAGATVRILQADVADEKRMQEVACIIKNEYGKLNGLIHAAGVAGGGLLQLRKKADIEKVLIPKVNGTFILDRVFNSETMDPDFFVLCSSMTSLLGEIGQIDYCAANSFLDAFAYYKNQTGKKNVLVVNWFTWKEVGMAAGTALPAELLQERERNMAYAIAPDEGKKVFHKILSLTTTQVFVSPVEIKHLLMIHSELTQRILQSIGNNTASGGLKPRPELQTSYVAPVTEKEKQISDLWSSLLGFDSVGIEDNFFELGGHSLIATQVISRICSLYNVDLKLQEFFDYPTIKDVCTLIADKTPVHPSHDISYKVFSLAPLTQEELTNIKDKNSAIEDIYSLSPMQQMVLGYNIFHRTSSLGVQYFTCIIEGELVVRLFKQAWEEVVRNHTILRTAFIWKKLKNPVQVVYSRVSIPIIEKDWQGLTPQKQEKALSEWLAEESKNGFFMEIPPLFRLTLTQMTKTTWQFIWMYQNSLLDGWSTSLILKEVLGRYSAFINKEDIKDKETPKFAFYIQWLSKQNTEAARTYWQDELAGYNPPEILENNQTSSMHDQSVPASKRIYLEESLTEQLHQFSKTNTMTLSTIFYCVWSLFLSSKQKTKDILIGSITSGRPINLKGVENMAGLFANTLPLRVQIKEEMSFIEFSQYLQKKLIQLTNFEYVSINDISKYSGVPVHVIQGAIHKRAMVFLNFQLEIQIDSKGIDHGLEIRNDTTKGTLNVPLRLYIIPEKRIGMEVRYNKIYYSEEWINNLITWFITVLTNIEKTTLSLNEIIKIFENAS